MVEQPTDNKTADDTAAVDELQVFDDKMNIELLEELGLSSMDNNDDEEDDDDDNDSPTLNEIDQKITKVADARKWSFHKDELLVYLVENSASMSPESKLLVSIVARQVLARAKAADPPNKTLGQEMFVKAKKGDSQGNSIANYVTTIWPKEMFEQIQKKIPHKPNKDVRCYVINVGFEFVRNSFVIDTAKKVEVLGKRNMDWANFSHQVFQWADSNRQKGTGQLADTATETKKYLQDLGVTPSNQSNPVPSSDNNNNNNNNLDGPKKDSIELSIADDLKRIEERKKEERRAAMRNKMRRGSANAASNHASSAGVYQQTPALPPVHAVPASSISQEPPPPQHYAVTAAPTAVANRITDVSSSRWGDTASNWADRQLPQDQSTRLTEPTRDYTQPIQAREGVPHRYPPVESRNYDNQSGNDQYPPLYPNEGSSGGYNASQFADRPKTSTYADDMIAVNQHSYSTGPAGNSMPVYNNQSDEYSSYDNRPSVNHTSMDPSFSNRDVGYLKRGRDDDNTFPSHPSARGDNYNNHESRSYYNNNVNDMNSTDDYQGNKRMRSEAPPGRGRGHGRGRGGISNPVGDYGDERFEETNNRGPSPGAGAGGGGGGRGIHQTRPAWMSRQEQSNQEPGPTGLRNDPLPPSGGGRGRHQTQPAWMTRNNNQQQQQSGPGPDRSEGPPSEGGAGRGRGRGLTLPAWMTQQQQT
jgi:hypothetical protein